MGEYARKIPGGPSAGQNQRQDMFNNPNTASSRIYVGNLSDFVSEEFLKTEFKAHGPVIGVLRKNKFAFIQFVSSASATDAIEKKNKTRMFDRIITVRSALKNGTYVEVTAPQSTSSDENGPPPAKMPRMTENSQQSPPNYHLPAHQIEIMVMDRSFTAYAEQIEERLKAANLNVEILFPKKTTPKPDILDLIQFRGTKFALEIDEINVEEQTTTVYTLYGETILWQQNMEAQEAIHVVQTYFESNNSQEYESLLTGFTPYEGDVKALCEKLTSLVRRRLITPDMLRWCINDCKEARFKAFGHLKQTNASNIKMEVDDIKMEHDDD